MLKSPSGYPDPITLIPRTGVQFVDLGFALPAKTRTTWLFYERLADGPDGQDEFRLLEEHPDKGALYFVEGGKEYTVPQETFSVTRNEVMEVFLDRWVPLPYFRVEPPAGFSLGPGNWCRMRLVDLTATEGGPDKDGNTHRLIIAFDTKPMAEEKDRAYLGPSAEDARSGRVFALAHEMRHIVDFLNQEWLELWLFELYKEREERRLKRRLSDDEMYDRMADGIGAPHRRELAVYAALLDLLASLGLAKRVSLVDIDTEPRQTPIEVDLVLDVGNSRTCGILIESDPDGGAALQSASRLELRDLSAPQYTYNEPFETRIEFAQPSFGKMHLSPRSGRSDAFMWPTIARVGPEAIRLAGLREGTGGDTGMSSPKRYLWDERPRRQSWYFNGRGVDGEIDPPAKDGAFAQLVNEAGRPRRRMEADDPANLPPVRALYSRSSMMMFALAEIFAQAINMINSPAHRWRRGKHQIRRRLRRIIMTMPTAMPLPERRILRERVADACDLVWEVLGLAPTEKPEISLDWDEASATQIVYLYTEIARNFGGDADAFLQAMLRPRLRQRPGGSLCVASIDIGGGTTDLIVTDYTFQGAGGAAILTPEQKFREGFNTAGDDILHAVIRRHVLPPIEQAMAEAGVAAPEGLMQELFGADLSASDKLAAARRQQFALQVASPIGLGMLAHYEHYDALGASTDLVREFDSFFADRPRPNRAVIDYVNKAARNRGGSDFDLRRVSFPVSVQPINETVRRVIDTTMRVLCEAVHAYDCDVLLLSGRPSRLPAVREIVGELLPLSPDRVIPLHRYRVGDWYPFRDAELRIDDPKTTAVVGATICVLAQGRLPKFALRSDLLVTRSTARIIGRIDDNGTIRDADVYIRNVDFDDRDAELPEHRIEFYATSALGFRQLDIDRWPATRLLLLDYASDEIARQLRPRLPLYVRLRRMRDRNDIERLRIDSVVDR
ncbi:MAG: virulence factor SrfB, partial [Rhodospirillales bacterium]|nr:virulence factor SrfB [Rhodospirillales bacterium]